MKNSKKKLLLWLLLCAALLAAALSFGLPGGKAESVQEAMRDAVLHDVNRISLFGIKEVNPAVISAFSVTGILLLLALILRLFVIPRFKLMPGRLQMVLETLVGTFSGMAKSNSPHRHKALGVYLFTAGVYIFSSTLFELFGFQAVTVEGHSIALPAPLSDVNAAIALGCLSYLFIMFGGILAVGPSGIGRALKEFSLPISMSFRLFGALLSGLLVTELVYYYITLSFVLPVIVGVLFTLLHALIQSYVLTMLTALYYGEVTEPKEPKAKAAAG
ncbi:MAG TPA: F0F1 ATP synthase subunit A [Candidatus Avilachnospira avistercoris]|nr:F0F1 ATP synthase subunit A [Candidatus Avilachnospira avistercoris]